MIYFIQRGGIDGPIKIGYALNPDKRLVTLQTASPERLALLATDLGDRHREAQLHFHFAECRISGEWYEPSDSLRTLIRELNSPILRRLSDDLDWIITEGGSYAVLWRDDEISSTQPCPYCYERHSHGVGDGHRIAHCVKIARPEIILFDKIVLRQTDGYWIKTAGMIAA